MSYLEDIAEPCPLCNQGTTRWEGVHRICMLRSALGGIGHLIDHGHWCLVVGDADAGLGWLGSARCVDALVATYGTDSVVDGSFPTTSLEDVCGWAEVSI